MPEITNDIIKDEEELGGFMPGDPDDESFMLETYGGYIGIMPDVDEIDIQEEIDDLEKQMSLEKAAKPVETDAAPAEEETIADTGATETPADDTAPAEETPAKNENEILYLVKSLTPKKLNKG